MADHLRTDLDELLFQSCQRPVFDRSGVASVRRKLPDMTFAEALAAYYAANTGSVLRPSDLSEVSAGLFRSHDMCHVIFGVDTTFADEALVDARTLLSCDAGVRKYARYLALSDDQPGSESEF